MKGYISKRFPWAKNFRYAPDDAVPYTHGIITTGARPFHLSNDEQALYELIDNRMKEALAGVKKFSELIVCIDIDGTPYIGTMPWKNGNPAPVEMPEIRLTGKSMFSHKAAPPKPNKMSHLLAAVATLSMKLTIKYNSTLMFNPDAHDFTDAIDRVCRNRFILDACGEPVVTASGAKLLDTFGGDLAVGTLLSHQVEADVLYGNPSVGLGGGKKVVDSFGEWIYNKVMEVIADPRLFPASADTHVCPFCKRHSVVAYPKTLRCHVCGFSMPLQYKGHVFTEKEVKDLLTHGYTSTDLKFTNRRGHEFFDAVALGNRRGLAIVPMAAKIY